MFKCFVCVLPEVYLVRGMQSIQPILYLLNCNRKSSFLRMQDYFKDKKNLPLVFALVIIIETDGIQIHGCLVFRGVLGC